MKKIEKHMKLKKCKRKLFWYRYDGTSKKMRETDKEIRETYSYR